MYITVKRSDPVKECGVLYDYNISGRKYTRCDAALLLHYIAEELCFNIESYVVIQNKIPRKEKALNKTLETLVCGHNLAITLGRMGMLEARKETKRILEKKHSSGKIKSLSQR